MKNSCCSKLLTTKDNNNNNNNTTRPTTVSVNLLVRQVQQGDALGPLKQGSKGGVIVQDEAL